MTKLEQLEARDFETNSEFMSLLCDVSDFILTVRHNCELSDLTVDMGGAEVFKAEYQDEFSNIYDDLGTILLDYLKIKE